MTNTGWVKLWRGQFDHWISKKPFCDGYAWCYLYAQANHKKGEVNFRNEYLSVDRGQVLKSKLQLQEIFGWTRRHIENYLKALEKDQMITYRMTNRYTLITILNYDKFQGKDDNDDIQNNSQMTNRKHTDDQQIANDPLQTRMNKNVKNEKNDKNKDNIAPTFVPKSEPKPKVIFNLETEKWENITDNDLQLWHGAYPACDLKIELTKMKAWLISNPTKAHKSNWKKFINGWLTRAQDRGGTLNGRTY